MTRQEFENIRVSMERERFLGDISDPIIYGLGRSIFERRKFEKLITAAKQVEQVDMVTVRKKLEKWNRQLERAKEKQLHFEKLCYEIHLHSALAKSGVPYTS